MRKIIALLITTGLTAILLTGCADRLQQRSGNSGESAANSVQQTQSAAANSAVSNNQNSALEDVTSNLNSMSGVIGGMDSANSQNLSIPAP